MSSPFQQILEQLLSDHPSTHEATPQPPEDLVVSPDPMNPRPEEVRREGMRRWLTNFTYSLGTGLEAGNQNPRGVGQRTQAGIAQSLKLPAILQAQLEAKRLQAQKDNEERLKTLATLGIQAQNARTAEARQIASDENADQTNKRIIEQNAEANRLKQLELDRKEKLDAATLRAKGFVRDDNGDIVPVPRDQMSEKEIADLDARSALDDLRKAQTDLAKATTDLREAQADPNSPQYQMARERLNIARQNAQTAKDRLGISQGNLDIREASFDAANFGGYGKAEVFLDSVSELADRINVSDGVYAKARGTAREAEAKLNLDDDVSEYNALVDAFTPLWARALGHTGVLTQQDVDSAKAALPKPGDSKSVKDRKIARIKKILSGQEKATETLTGRENPATPKPKTAVIEQHSPSTGLYRYSTDGGKTWTAGRAPK